MTPDEIIDKWIGNPFLDDDAAVSEATREIVAGLKAAIVQAITAAVEEDRRARPHTFVGRTDRPCELCGEPDRDEIHIASREMLRNRIKLAVEDEREACAKIADDSAAIAEQNARRGDGEVYDHRAEQSRVIASWIRARSTASDHSAGPAEK